MYDYYYQRRTCQSILVRCLQCCHNVIFSLYSFFDKTLPEWYVSKGEPKSQAGQHKGLKLILDGHSDQISPGTVFDDFNGFVTLVGDRNSFPLTHKQSFLIRPGLESNVAITATSVISDGSIESIDPAKRNCYFPHEKSLKLYRNYSQANCLFECQTDYARSQLDSKCTPWYFPGMYNLL